MGKIVFIVMLMCSLGLQAHAPKALELSYDGETATLSVKVLHRVSNPEKHFVKSISVFAGEELLAEKAYERQESAESQSEIFLFLDKPLRQGQAVTVKATCSIMGEKSAELEWE